MNQSVFFGCALVALGKKDHDDVDDDQTDF
jgi:hypothetical protein